MNKLLIIALLTVVATPAYATSRRDAAPTPNTVYSYQGDVIGADPDPNVRASLLKDYHAL